MILNRQRHVRISISRLEKFLAAAQKRLGVAASSLTVALVSDAEIARWNRSYRGKNKPTDVLSFPVEDEAAAKGNFVKQRSRRRTTRSAARGDYLGDIAIAPRVARKNAEEFGRTFEIEMRILILHGILHLMGYDHETDTGQMERRENRLRRELGLA
jgi:probable rRNA maturation factor